MKKLDVVVPEDAEQLVDLAIAREERTLGDKLGKDAADGPHVDGSGVASLAEQDLGGAVPKRDHLVSIGADGHAKRAGETKVGQLENALAVDEQVGQLQVPVQNAVRVAVRDALEDLIQVALEDRTCVQQNNNARGQPTAGVEGAANSDLLVHLDLLYDGKFHQREGRQRTLTNLVGRAPAPVDST